MTLAEIHSKIEAKSARLAVIGLGYVGFPIACVFSRAGYDVVGIELQAERVRMINAGHSPIVGIEPGLQELISEVVATGRLHATDDFEQLRDRDVILICVETPVDEQHHPNYTALRGALRSLGAVMKTSALVVIESTIAPGTMRDVVLPVLEQSSGMRLNEGFFLGNCPERVMPGKLLANIHNLERVAGGMTPETAEVMRRLYREIVQAEIDTVDCLTAELVKTVENAYRDVQIAFANEVAMICEGVGGDVWKVRELVNKSPGRSMLLPGAGVGGHCIPKDPWLLAYSVMKDGAALRVIPAARAVNSGMPQHMGDLLFSALRKADVEPARARILVMGYTYLEDSDDTRNSPSAELLDYLGGKVEQIVVHDPFVHRFQGDLLEKARGCDAAVVMVSHSAYRSLDLAKLGGVMRRRLLIDGRATYGREQAEAAGFRYKGVGLGSERIDPFFAEG